MNYESMTDRELDLLITEHIMKWIAWEEHRGDYRYVVFQKPGEREPYKNSRNWEKVMDRYRQIPFSEIDHMKHIVMEIKDYSTDISAAWEVVEKMKSNNWYFVLSDGLYPDKWNAMFYWDENQTPMDAYASTAPKAMCIAALKALDQ